MPVFFLRRAATNAQRPTEANLSRNPVVKYLRSLDLKVVSASHSDAFWGLGTTSLSKDGRATREEVREEIIPDIDEPDHELVSLQFGKCTACRPKKKRTIRTHPHIHCRFCVRAFGIVIDVVRPSKLTHQRGCGLQAPVLVSDVQRTQPARRTGHVLGASRSNERVTGHCGGCRGSSRISLEVSDG